ncbi:hypothetical protein FX983_00327 [Pseudomonas frederiksbergensis]|uniref:Uncharacterized protein n=1 Tax=Pseudomonas frederiksbergensis TaxID=104087 RepID=A0A6L5BUC6_9PSED|nr:hypothetical protein FX983_00327 [Pseudomonas frederiksbergensis]
MTVNLTKRYSLSDILRNADYVKALNTQTASTRDGDFVGFENVFCDLKADQNKQREILEESFLQSILMRKPENEGDYDALALALDELLEITGDDESHPLMRLVDIIGEWIEEWDHEHHPHDEVQLF